MKGLFKKLGKGILFVFILPFWVIAFLLFTVFALCAYFYTLFAAIPAYLRGESVLSPTEIDIAASTKLAEQKKQAQMAPPAPVVQSQTTIILNAVPLQNTQEEKPITYVEHEKEPGEMRQLTEKDFQESLPEAILISEEDDQE